MQHSSSLNAEIEEDLAALARTPIAQLRERWREIFRTEPPPAFGPDLLRRGIAQRLQEKHYGGISATPQRQLDQIIKAMAANPGGRIELPRRIMPGAVLVRTWKDKSHRVTILDDGFSFEGKTYRSLSQIAREITGARWNGPRFFGLRTTRKVDSNGVASSATDHSRRRRGRSTGENPDLFGPEAEVRHGN